MPRVYVSGALLHAADLTAARELYERFADACRHAGWDAYVPHQHADPVRDAALSNQQVARRDLDELRGSDAVVAFVGEPSLGVGAELALALSHGMRVLAVAPSGSRVSRFLLGLLELHPEQASVFRYRSVDEAESWIAGALGVQRG